jgi:hypothetical protein
MSDSVLKRYTNPRAPFVPRGEVLDEGDDSTDDLGCYGWLRGLRERSPMLEFRRKDGRSVAYDYALLRKVEFDPSEGITLHFDGEVVRIEGRNLDDEPTPGIQLLRGIHIHRVPWVRELGESDILEVGEDRLVIERFDFE